MSLRMTTAPDTYFVDHADGNRAPRNGRETSVCLTPPLEDWVNFAQMDLPQSPRNKIDVVSLAIDFGASRPMAAWGMPVGRFNDIAHQIHIKRGNERMLDFRPMDLRHEPEKNDFPTKVRLDQNTFDLLDSYSRLLGVGQSMVARCCMGVAFRWYDNDVFNGDKVPRYRESIDFYCEDFREELELRIEYAEEQLGMDL